jgi:hypothetical protein
MSSRKRNVTIVGSVLLLPVIGYWVGQSYGSNREMKQRTKRDLVLHGKLVELDQWFLAGVAAQPSTMTSGKYTLEKRWAGRAMETSVAELEISDGCVRKMTGLRAQDIMQTGKVVSWKQVDADEGPSARFVGLMDGDGMWGRVYMEPGQGWHEGEPPAYGVWRLQRRSGP